MPARGRALVLVLAAAFLLTGCAAGPAGGTYRIGAVLPLSGPSEFFTEEIRPAIDVGVDYANAHLGLRKKLEVSYVDGQGQPAPSVTGMNRAVNVDRSLAVLTAFSAITKALAPVANRAKVPLFNGGASSPDLRGLGRYVFNDLPLANQQLPAAMDYVVRQRGLADWFVVFSDETLGQSMKATVETGLPAAGGRLVGSMAVAQTATDFGPQVAKIRAVNPRVVLVALADANQVSVFAHQLRQAGVTAQLVSYAATASLLREPAAEGMVLCQQSVDQNATDPLTRDFFTEYRKRAPNQPSGAVQANYASAVVVLATAIKSLEDAGTEVTGEHIVDAINRIGEFQVVGGRLRFNPDGTVNAPVDVVTVHDGGLTAARS